jgi:hypothetical protein
MSYFSPDYFHPGCLRMNPMNSSKWISTAPFSLAAAYLVSRLIYLTGDYRAALGPAAYALADFFYGPLFAAGLVITIWSLHERFEDQAPRRVRLAEGLTLLAAMLFLLTASLRAANRQYHLVHPELELENSIPVPVTWTTLVAGVAGAGWHLLGWALALLGWAGWSTAGLPRAFCGISLLTAAAALFVYALPNLEDAAGGFFVIWVVWAGVLMIARPRGSGVRTGSA